MWETYQVIAADNGSIASSSMSISQSILGYRIENGRTYHRYKDGNMQHEIFTYTIGDRLGRAPPCDEDAKVGRVLDVGTGTGIWAIDFGELHPEAEVYGVDLSPNQPEYVPENVRFEIDDVDEDWTYSKPFDYIHSRFMTGAINNWRKFFESAYDHLNPGGWFEVQDADINPQSDDDTFPKDCALAEYVQLLQSGAEAAGCSYVDIPSLAGLMTEVGFVDVSIQMYKWPINGWPKEDRYKKLGLWTQENFSSALQGLCMALFTRVLGWSRARVEGFLINVRHDVRNRDFHAYFRIREKAGSPGAECKR
ncbi:TAM domain methyltransferase [Colletotrichum scovillei]|uniref:TAM domain methyltransferase n=1 Tax=Colletotrichum scovillei TaxID=1209932 RepID=A0A9P7R838_9PEZI|nr:TAM domain methyltransferase [Colletotrichum scovillei]KAG7069693.1 TAM domain methyltransferase [Colletotrichum scovillei]KAG7073636.1 TAM domain methyltransferase [Colletotrichum scovillei]